MLAMEFNLPLDEDSLDNISRTEHMATVAAPEDHNFRVWVCGFIAAIEG